MKNWKKLLSVMLAVVMLLSVPVSMGFARAFAGSSFEPTGDYGVLDPSTLNVKKLGDVEEVQGPDNDEEVIEPNRIVRASIFFDGLSTLEKGFGIRGLADNRLAVEYRNQLKATQDAMQTAIEKLVNHKLYVKWRLTLAANAISVELPYKDIARIKLLPGVKSVVLESRYEAPRDAVENHPNTAFTSENMVGAAKTWNELSYTGAGSRIAIIDTGLDIAHQSVDAGAFDYALTQLKKDYSEELFTADDLAGITGLNSQEGEIKPAYGTSKIPYMYNYVDGNANVTHTADGDTQGEHGSHVAGIAAANRFIPDGAGGFVPAVDIENENAANAVGMAPDAQLFVMKVFGVNGGAYDSDYMAAIEDAILLDCDVVNLSLGSSVQGWTFSEEYQDILNSLSDPEQNEGMVVSISAGNSYSLVDMMDYTDSLYIEDVNMHTGGSPGTYVNSLCVAAAQNTTVKGMPLYFDYDKDHKVFYSETLDAGNPAMTSVAGTYDYVYIDAVGNPEDYATVNDMVSLDGKVVIVNRGTISFFEKGNNAIEYKPKALIVANNADGTINMSLDGFTGKFPMVSILLVDAQRIKQTGKDDQVGDIHYYTGKIEVTDKAVHETIDKADATITDFSSWGVPGSLLMKPEITAPGGDIYSIWGTNNTTSGGVAGGTDKYELMSGTSMAAPHITGLAAVIAQYLRENDGLANKEASLYNEDLTSRYSTRAINQSLMMSTATPMSNKDSDDVYQYLSILQQGAGLVEVYESVTSPSVIMIDEKDSYLTGKTGAAADGKVKIELGDDVAKTGKYTYKFDIYNITDEALTYQFNTDIFTQAIDHVTFEYEGETYDDGCHMSKVTTPLEGAKVNHVMVVDNPDLQLPEYDVDKDGDTDEEDAQAVLDYVTGILKDTDTGYDWVVADADKDQKITSYDARLILQRNDASASDTIPAHGKGTVTVTITLDKDDLKDYPRGAYIEGFTYAATTTKDNVKHIHSIPILGFYGSWTDPSMFDAASYIDSLYTPNGMEKASYTGKESGEETNYMTLTVGGEQKKFAGNPYMVEEEFPAERLAINSESVINSITYNLYRAAAATGFAVTRIDGIGGRNTAVVNSLITANNIDGIYYSPTGSWANTTTRSYTVNKTAGSYGFDEYDTLRVGFYAIPEYNSMVVNNKYTESSLIKAEQFDQLLLDNLLGIGSYIGFDFTVDNEAPKMTNPAFDEEDRTVTFSASDNLNLAYVAILSLDGSEKYYETAPGTDKDDYTIDVSNAVAEANGYVAVFIADYAGNETAMYVKVNDKIQYEKDIYVLTNTITAGNDYLIVNRNTAGSAGGLSYESGTLSSSPSSYVVTVNPGNDGTEGQPYIELADIPDTGIWTAAGDEEAYYFSNGGKYVGHLGDLTNLQITGSTVTADWIWDGSNNTLSYNYLGRSRYMVFAGGKFTVSTSAGKVYLYEKKTIPFDVEPVKVTGISVSPETLDMYKGNTAALTARILPLTATDRKVNWYSSNSSVATVDQNKGIVTAVAPGVATITAQSRENPNLQATCTVNVTVVNNDFNAIVQDKDENIYFSSFNTGNLIPNSNEPYQTLSGAVQPEDSLVNAYLYTSSTLYASTQNFAGDSYLYEVNTGSFELGEPVKTYVAPFGLADGPDNPLYGPCAAIGFATFLLAGPIDEVTEGEGALMPIGLLDTSTFEDGPAGAYIASVCLAENAPLIGGYPSYYFLDENGKIWKTTMKRMDSEVTSLIDIIANLISYSFTDPELVADTKISTSFMNQNIYFDGTYIYWAHCDGVRTELLIIDPDSQKVYNAGDFGDGVWPVGGIYSTNGTSALSVGGDTRTASLDQNLPEKIDPVITREQLMTPEVMARMQAEAEKMKSITADAADGKAVVESVSATVQNTEQTAQTQQTTGNNVAKSAPGKAVSVSKGVMEKGGAQETAQFTGTVTETGSVELFASPDSTNGYFLISYPEGLTFDQEKDFEINAEIEGLKYSVSHDTTKREVKIAYAKSGDAVSKDTAIATVMFTADCTVKDDVTVTAKELNEELSLAKATTFTVPASAHGTITLVKEAKKATCTEPGNKAYYKCTVCGALFEDASGTKPLENEEAAVIPAPGHTPGDPVKENVTEAVTCGQTASWDDVVYCTVCETEISREHHSNKPLSHTLEKTEAVAATCTKAGNIAYYTCSVCNKIFSDTEGKTEITLADIVVPAKGHAWGDWTEVSDTQHRRVCQNDEAHVQTENHTWGDGVESVKASCTEPGTITYTCTACGAEKNDHIDALGHDYKHYDAVPATCEADGTIGYYKCTRCGNMVTDTTDAKPINSTDELVDPALGHDLVNVAAKAATCGEKGNTTYYKCSRCGAIFADAEGKEPTTLAAVTIPKLNHNHIVEVPKQNPTIFEDGYEAHYECDDCGTIFTDAEGMHEATLSAITIAKLVPKTASTGAFVPEPELRAVLDKALAQFSKDTEVMNAINSGEEVTLEVIVKPIEAPKNKSAFENAASGKTVGAYFDIEVILEVGNLERIITELSDEITITLVIPENLRGHTNYYVVREHNGNYDLIRCTLSADKTHVTFKSKLFSTYALAYSDTMTPSDIVDTIKDKAQEAKETIVNTADENDIRGFLGIFSASMIGLAVTVVLKKKSEF